MPLADYGRRGRLKAAVPGVLQHRGEDPFLSAAISRQPSPNLAKLWRVNPTVPAASTIAGPLMPLGELQLRSPDIRALRLNPNFVNAYLNP